MATPTLLTSVAATPGNPGGTTGAMDTTWATLVVVSVSHIYGTSSSYTVTDNYGNVYTPLTKRGFTTAMHQFFYCQKPSLVGGPGHTWTVTGNATGQPAIIVQAWSNTGGYHIDVGNYANSTTVATGSVTPPTNGCLVLTGVSATATGVSGSVTSPAGFTQQSIALVAGTNPYAALSYYIQPTAGAINPTWTMSPTGQLAASTLVFRDNTPTATLRATQVVTEVVALPVPTLRITQLAVEVASTATAAAAIRASQVVAEVATLAPLSGGEKAFMFYD